jgi:hypothetical protein
MEIYLLSCPMARWYHLLVAAILLIALVPGATAGSYVKSEIVDIERYIDIRINFTKGEAMGISAHIVALSYPVNVMLIKGEEEFRKFQESDFVDLEEIKSGNITDKNVTFQVVQGFSRENVTEFESSIRIGDHDMYHLVIMLYRDSSMDPDTVLRSRVTIVNIDAEWEVRNNEVQWFLIPIAAFALLVGIGLLAYYFWPREKEPLEDPLSQREPLRRQPPGRTVIRR